MQTIHSILIGLLFSLPIAIFGFLFCSWLTPVWLFVLPNVLSLLLIILSFNLDIFHKIEKKKYREPLWCKYHRACFIYTSSSDSLWPKTLTYFASRIFVSFSYIFCSKFCWQNLGHIVSLQQASSKVHEVGGAIPTIYYLGGRLGVVDSLITVFSSTHY